jgi:LmbE family N-acetylglucosaminyl deacetylase
MPRSQRPRPGDRNGGAFVVSFLVLLLLVLPNTGAAQLSEPPAGSGELALLLRQMDGERRVLMVAAHPDDEDTALLSVLARGMGVRTAYLSLSRGEGGQNLIGPEMGEGLGLIRTGELLAARSLDGATQYFSRAFDFGFSKSAQETFRHWPEEEILEDIVRVIRDFRPHVIVSIFHGTARDGHGHHQAAGILAHRAFEVAGDSTRFVGQLAEGLLPWAPTKLYHHLRGDVVEAELRVETGQLDPLLGRSHFQIAMASRSRHRSQDMGVPELPGPQASRLALVRSRGYGTDDPKAGLFHGITTDLLGLAEAAGGGMAISRSLRAWQEEIARAGDALHPENPARALPALQGARVTLDESVAEARRSRERAGSPSEAAAWADLEEALAFRERSLAAALQLAAGVVVDVRADRARVSPGETIRVEVSVWNGGASQVTWEEVGLDLPEGWEASRPEDPGPIAEDEYWFAIPEVPLVAPGARLAPGSQARAVFDVRVPEAFAPSVPYFLRAPREESLYRWPADDPALALPGDLPLVHGKVNLRIGGTDVAVRREASHVRVDKALGQFRVPLFVAPAFSVSTDRASMAWPDASGAGTGSRSVTVRVENLSAETRQGSVRLQAPVGWEVEPSGARVDLVPNTEASFVFGIRSGGEISSESGVGAAGGGAVADFRAVVESGGGVYDRTFTLVDYPHIDPMPFVMPAVLRVSRFPLEVREGIRVGYVMGPGDGGFQALRDMEVDVELLDAGTLRSGELSRYDAIVLGARAYETRTDLIASNDRILEYARAGGTVIAQYNKYEFPDGGFAPFPVTMRRPHHRVTDPAAEVRFLEPHHPLLVSPNRLGTEDFAGWQQERGLYFLESWDAAFTPLLEMADPDEAPTQGSLLVARVGEGAYVYTGLALFRQWPEGVPGAFRLLANLVSLRGDDLR